MLTAALARAPYAMLPLGLMTAFTASTGDLAIGGLATGAFSIATACCSPLIGRASDIWGQRRVLLTLIPLNSLGILSLFWAATTGLSGPLLFVLCALTGMTVVPVGSFTRARWVSANAGPKILSAAFSYESMADEFVFVLGPALVGVAASMAHPSSPLFLSFALMLLAGIPFALSSPRTDETPVKLKGDSATPVKHPSIAKVLWAVLPAIAALVSVGVFFGSAQAGTTARADLAGVGSQAGLIYAVMGVGSAIAALLVVVLPAAFRLSARFIVFSLGMGITITWVAFVEGIASTTWILALAGIFIGPTLVTAFSAAEGLAPAGGTAVAMTLMSSSVTVGVSIGSALGGSLAQDLGATASYLLGSGASVIVFAVGLVLALPYFRSRYPHV